MVLWFGKPGLLFNKAAKWSFDKLPREQCRASGTADVTKGLLGKVLMQGKVTGANFHLNLVAVPH